MNTPKEIVIITVVGAATLGFFSWRIWLARQASHWPHAMGTVTASEVTYQSVSTGDKSETNYTVSVNYEYSVAGTKYSSKRVTYFGVDMKHRTRDTADKQRAKYAEGSMIKVLYNPGNPADAIVEIDIPRTFYFAAAIGAIFFAGGITGLIRVLT